MYDVIVVGLGAMGSASLYQLAKRGAKVLGIDRYAPPHNLGSTHGETRVTRLAVGEGAEYTAFVARTHDIWRDLEEKTGEGILYESGVYVICPKEADTSFNGVNDFVAATADIAKQYDIPAKWQSADTARTLYPQLLIPDQFHTIHEPTGGVVVPETAVAVQLAEAARLGAKTRLNEVVLDVEQNGDGVIVTTNLGKYEADKAVVSAGAWVSDFLPDSASKDIHITRQVMHWFEADDITQFNTDNLPVALWVGETMEDYFCIFPTPPNGETTVKVVTERYFHQTHPDDIDRVVHQDEIELILSLIHI